MSFTRTTHLLSKLPSYAFPSPAARKTALSTLPPGWTDLSIAQANTQSRNAISKEFVFLDFNQAFAFMTRVALTAESVDHHPEWSNVYNQVNVTLATHDCDGVSTKDIDMAMKMEEYADGVMPMRRVVTQKAKIGIVES